MKHGSHPELIARLRRAHGHLGSVIEMIERGRTCLDIAQQLHAVESAVTNAKRELIKDHMEHCLNGDPDAGSAVREFRALAKYL
jgi:uncharacterized protein